MLQRSNADLDGRAKEEHGRCFTSYKTTLLFHLQHHSVICTIFSPDPPFFLGQKVFLILLLLQLSFADEPQG